MGLFCGVCLFSVHYHRPIRGKTWLPNRILLVLARTWFGCLMFLSFCLTTRIGCVAFQRRNSTIPEAIEGLIGDRAAWSGLQYTLLHTVAVQKSETRDQERQPSKYVSILCFEQIFLNVFWTLFLDIPVGFVQLFFLNIKLMSWIWYFLSGVSNL